MTAGRPRKPKPVTQPTGDLVQAVDPPGCLDEVAKSHWREVMAELTEKNIVARLDLGSLTAMCEAYSEYVRILGMLNGKVPMVETAKGNWVQHPLLGVKNHAAERYLKFACQFGMTPAARAKLAEEQVTAASKLKKYMG